MALASTAHGITRDGQGNLWFNVNPGRNSLGKIEPADRKDHRLSDSGRNAASRRRGDDRRGRQGHGVGVRAGRRSSLQSENPGIHGIQNHAGETVLRHGRHLWRGRATATAMAGGRKWASTPSARPTSRPAKSLKSSCRKTRKIRDFLTQQEIAAYGKVTDISTGNPYPWAQGPRRMGTDKNGDVLWVGNSWGSTLARIDTKTNTVEDDPVPDFGDAALPHCGGQQAQCLGRSLDERSDLQIRPRRQEVDHVRNCRCAARKCVTSRWTNTAAS